MRVFICLLSAALLLASCKKHRLKKYLGTYRGVKTTDSWTNGLSGPVHSLQSFPTAISVSEINSDNEIRVAGKYVSLSKDGHFSESGGNYHYSVSFKDDSLTINESDGALGFGNTMTFRGKKD